MVSRGRVRHRHPVPSWSWSVFDLRIVSSSPAVDLEGQALDVQRHDPGASERRGEPKQQRVIASPPSVAASIGSANLARLLAGLNPPG